MAAQEGRHAYWYSPTAETWVARRREAGPPWWPRHAHIDELELIAIGKARGVREFRGGTLPRCVAELTTDLYNKRRSAGRLEDWR